MINFPKWLEDQSDADLAEYVSYADYMIMNAPSYQSLIWQERKAQALAEQNRRASND